MSDAQPNRTRSLVRWLLICLGLLVSTLLDTWVYLYHTIDRERALWSAEWWQVFRQAGNLMPWCFVACAFMLHDIRLLNPRQLPRGSRSAFLHRGSMIVLSAGFAGLAAEILKGISQRGRPIGLGVYRFGWVEEVRGYGLASSHAAVAFGAAFMVGRLFPGAFWPIFILACGTAYSRITPGAHYLSDLYVAGVLAWLVSRGLWHWLGRFPGGHAHAVTLLRPARANRAANTTTDNARSNA
jgi:membrane-associated phospholipid phosphatase